MAPAAIKLHGPVWPPQRRSDFTAPAWCEHTSLPEDYSRVWRPYGWACATDNSVLGPGYNASAGLAGSVFGADQLRIEWQRSEASAPGGASIQILSIRYRHYF